MSISLQILLCVAVVIVAANWRQRRRLDLDSRLCSASFFAGVILGPSLLNIWGIHWLAQSSAGVAVGDVFKIWRISGSCS